MSAAVSTSASQVEVEEGLPRQAYRGQRHPRHGAARNPDGHDPGDSGSRRNTHGRGGRFRPDGHGGVSLANATPDAAAQSQPNDPNTAHVSSANNGSRQRRGRGGRSGGARRDLAGANRTVQVSTNLQQQQGSNGAHPTPANPSVRQFGGQLTSLSNGGVQLHQSHHLNASAPDFLPSRQQRNHQSSLNAAQEYNQPRRIGSKSLAPDIATRTHHDIDNGHYECPICTNEVLRNSKIWSCRTCWTVFHLSCVKKWASNEGSTQQQPQNEEVPLSRQWRCPGCNLPQDSLPGAYTCWCEKEFDPRPTPGLPPHSCGNTCGRERQSPKRCPHPCLLTCHAGPCPPCTHMGPTQLCFCGKQSATRRCVDTDYDNGWSCGAICDDLMPCGEHQCEKPCHEGLCGACTTSISARCYCGNTEKSILCCERGDEKESRRLRTDSTLDHWTGLFQCGNTCNREFDCGIHRCERPCHKQDAETPHCPRSPDIVTRCPCGKTSLKDISATNRQTCEDPIPNCDKRCHKPLGCGHLCPQLCHPGECMLCLQVVPITCRCGKTVSGSICHQGREEPPQCMRVCRATLSCGRHNCDERCCPADKKTSERPSGKRKQRPLDSAPQSYDEGFAAEHICTRLCGRPLRCGNHTCQELCHKGPCGSCREAIFEEVSCHCGRTVLQPPLPCGTQPPPCHFNCDRPKTCGHAQVAHNCHLDTEPCPKCPYLTVKQCTCGKKMLKNQPCWLKDVHCGEPCGKMLRCGSHYCRKLCHAQGECEDAGRAGGCQQKCSKPKRSCGHPDEELCHAPFPCKEDKACGSKIFITCPCQHLKQEAKCNASKDNEGNSKKSLKCDEECARLERNRKLALALNIDPETHRDDHVPYSSETLSKFQENVTWAQAQEREFRTFAASEDEKRLRFKPMPPNQRAFLHALAEDFGFDSESMDPEPHRHVAIFKTPRFVMAPTKTLAECAKIRHNQRLAAANAAASDGATKQKKSNQLEDPFNGFVITSPRFALTVEELRAVLNTALGRESAVDFDISFLPSEEVALKPRSQSQRPLDERALESLLKTVERPLVKAISGAGLGKIQLCRMDESSNILRRDNDQGAGGWSQVAARAAAPARAPRQVPVGSQSSFSVLSSGKVTLGKKKAKEQDDKPRAESVVDDWEAAELMEEEKENAAASVGSADESGPTGTMETVEKEATEV